MYKVQKGDTLEDIARKVYGTPDAAALLREGNPGLGDSLPEGIVIVTPSDPTAPAPSARRAPSQSRDEVAILINGKRFRYWTTANVTRNLDSVDTFTLTAPFDPDRREFREAFRPFSFQRVEVTVGGEPLFTGVAVSVTPTMSADQNTVVMSGYSLPGVMNDCTQPASAYPIEYNDLRLAEVCRRICRPFGIRVVDRTDGGAVFDRVAANTSETGFNFLSGLAQQRASVLGSTPAGELEIRKPDTAGNPVADLQQGQPPLQKASPMFNAQQYYSHITGLEPAIVGIPGDQHTTRNDFLQGVLRPHVFSATDADPGTLPATVDAKMGRMFANMASYALTVTTWRDQNGGLWEPASAVSLTAPRVMVYNKYIFQIRSVSFDATEDSVTAGLDVIMPGGYSGQQPETLPWDE